MTTWQDTRNVVRQRLEARLTAEERASMELRRRVVPLVEHVVAAARHEGLLRRAWLFGSFVWGNPGEASDVDLLVEGAGDPFLVAAQIGSATKLPVHVVRLEDAPLSLRDRVLAEGHAL